MPAPDGPQFVRVYHASYEDTPPHLQKPMARHMWTPDSNMHPDVIHMGSSQSALDIMGEQRPFVHAYDIDISHPKVSPVVWGDENQIIEEDDLMDEMVKKGTMDQRLKEAEGKTRFQGKSLLQRQFDLHNEFSRRMSGVQPGLWEETPADAQLISIHKTVTPYRNRREDLGSVSWLVPKGSIGRAVKYAGVKTRQQHVSDALDEEVKQK